MLSVDPLSPTGVLSVNLEAEAQPLTTSPQQIEVQQVPNGIIATGPGPGRAPLIRIFDSEINPITETHDLITEFFAYVPQFTGGVRIATGDVNNDGIVDVITAPGAGGGPHIRVFSGATGAVLGEFFAYEPSFLGGVHVASADVNGDGFDDIITGPGAGAPPLVRVFSGATGQLIDEFLAYAGGFQGGVNVAAGYVNNDQFAEVITGAGPGGGPHVRIFNGFDGVVIGEFFAYDPAFTGGVFVASGDFNGDSFWDVVTGAGSGGGPHVKVFSGFDASVLASFFAYAPTFSGGVRVGTVNTDGDIFADIVTGPGFGGGPLVRVFDAVTLTDSSDFFAYPRTVASGLYVAGGGLAPTTLAAGTLTSTATFGPSTAVAGESGFGSATQRMRSFSAGSFLLDSSIRSSSLDTAFEDGLSDLLLRGWVGPAV